MSVGYWLIAILLLVYTIIPTVLVRLFGVGAYKKGRLVDGIALTFDDGPDPDYTSQLLDLLGRFQVQATFFVLGSKAERYPDLILRMHQEGHLIGIHNYAHRANAWMTPRKVRKQLNDSVKVIENIIGVKPIFYRPPWGIINIFDLFLMKRFHFVFWSLMVGDWRTKGGKERILAKLLGRVKNNDIIVLHDSGQTFGADPHAPVFMLEALGDFLEESSRRGYTMVRIDARSQADLNSRQKNVKPLKSILVFLWLKWEYCFHWLFNIHPIDQNHPIFYSRVRKYKGKTICMDNGEEIRAGDMVVELHFNNKKLFQLISESNSMVQLAVNMIRDVQRFLPAMTQYLHMHHQVRGVYGITMIHRGSKQLGFTVEELPKGLFNVFSHIYLRLLLFIIHPNGRQRLELKRGLLTPRIVAISVQELKRRYPVEPFSDITKPPRPSER
ncbi:polysaccharide deacetylase family protein [Paenibacillus sedimenti]|uniref:Polysaccharide deacetylase family protein n=1 Tax=Paenibacillus sedimenti TaxID=2770274 RepID=A0A926QLM5_9BACL|nr:polysaccharide deacetylase family protein [Paenibacillus sedimenti]MBD0382993.1 polysaccharide deacetylase family protein [Paenibacillus sedimenti]